MNIGERIIIKNVLGDDRLTLFNKAASQTFIAIDPTGIDNPTRPGERTSTECYGFEDELEWFWSRVEETVCEAAGITPTSRMLRLKRTQEGGFYGRHIDGAFPGAELPYCAFIYYIGDRSSYEGGALTFDDEAIETDDDLLVVFRAQDPHSVQAVISAPGREALRLTIAGILS